MRAEITTLIPLHRSPGQSHICLQQSRISELILGHKGCDLEDVLAQQHFAGELTHLQLHLQCGWPHHWAAEHQLSRLPVGAPHGKDALAPATYDGEAQAVTHKAGGGHLEEDVGHGAVGLEW